MSRQDRLAPRVTRDGDRVQVRSPAVGVWSDIPATGTLVGPGSIVGRLSQLNRRFVLELEDDVSGIIELADPRRRRNIAYGEVMFQLTPISDAKSTRPTGDGGGRSEDEPAFVALLAPTDGVFYHRPAPDVAAFVKIGQRIHRGQTVGLIEVMKTFNQIVYDGRDLPQSATIAEIRVGDGEEVRAGQPLIVFE